MNNHVTYTQAIQRLEEQRLAYGILPLQNGMNLIITQRGGRVFGPFLPDQGESVTWLNRAFLDQGAFGQFIAAGESNIGGERLWLTPEIQYNVRDRTRFDATYSLSPQLDPGHYTLEQVAPARWRLAQDLTLDLFNVASGTKDLSLDVLIQPAADPLRYLRGYAMLIEGVLFAGYEQIVTLSERRSDAVMSETWNLVQVNPGGTMVIPAAPGVEWADYYEPVGEHQAMYPNHVRLAITGTQRYKLGYKAAHLTGRLGYFNRLDDGQAYLIVRNFFNNPSAPYVEEAGAAPGAWGDSVHIYNDGGALGGFGELEVHGQTIGGFTGRSSSTDQLVFWLYVGAPDRVAALIPHLLGIAW